VDFFYLPLILVLSGYFIPFWASAQQTYGLRLGMNMSTFRLSIDDSDSVNPFQFKYVMGIASGGHARFGFGRLFSLQPELQYSRLGGSWFMDDSSIEELTYTVRHHWLQGLILARIDIPYKKFHFHILVGPHVGYSIGKVSSEVILHYEDEFETYTIKNKEKISWDEVGESLRRFEPGVTAGLGFDFPLGPGRIGADLRFQRGFSSWINPEPGLVYFSNMNFQLGCSYSMVMADRRS